MKSLILKKKEKMDLRDITSRNLDSMEVAIQVKACGICGTDVHIFHGKPGSAEVTFPIVLGHELAGEVIEVGKEVSNFKVGDRVAVDPNIYCQKCSYCRSGKIHLCSNLQAIGVTRDGGMQEVCHIPEANAYLLPQEVSYEEGALVEPLSCVLHGIKKIDLSPTQEILIVGGGFIGQLFLQLIAKRGLKNITVCEVDEMKKEQLFEFGANKVINPLEEKDFNQEFDVVIECVGRKETMEIALNNIKKGGQLLVFGVSSPEMKVEIKPYEIFQKELRIFGSFINPNTVLEAISLINTKEIQVSPLISHKFKLEEIEHVLANYPSYRITKGIILI
ncbi:zinc-dependent alcohol dehydrogenase family protein [Priestia megaterium]|uniref:zinc-dependent alcohol dehydrogenase family protein n=1 Tax=Priestia megaterium TaxID=1404 RepID=UPI003671A1AC